MLELKLRVQKFCETIIKEKIDNGGFAFVDPQTGTILFYSGPSGKILKKIEKIEKEAYSQSNYPPNWTLAKDEADRLKANRLDNTLIFPFLWSTEFKKLLIQSCNLAPVEISGATDQVWDYVSGCFARTDFHKAATLVCGASKDSSFYQEEMLGMLEGTHLQVLNDRPADLFREFRSLGKDEVHRLMAMTYLQNMRAHARSSNDPRAKDNYRNQRKYFVLSRQEEKQSFAKHPEDVRLAFRQTRRDILSRFPKDTADASTPMRTAPTVSPKNVKPSCAL